MQVYHLAVTLNAMANPLMAFLAFFLPCRRRSVVLGLAATGCLLSGYILATAGEFNIYFLRDQLNIFLCAYKYVFSCVSPQPRDAGGSGGRGRQRGGRLGAHWGALLICEGDSLIEL